MASHTSRLATFVGFILSEYARSGRVLVEIIATLVGYYLLFRRSEPPLQPSAFFSLAGLLTLGLTFYTTSVMMSVGDRPQGYLVLTRRLGRGGYLLGHYLGSLLLVVACYGLLSLACAILSPIAGLSVSDWLLGSIPLLLNVAMLAAAITLIAPIVLTPTWRLVVLAAISLAFSGSIINSQTLRDMAPLLRDLLGSLQVVFSAPLLPAFTGFALSVSRDYGSANIAIPFAQLSLTLGLLALALYVFARREIVFHG